MKISALRLSLHTIALGVAVLSLPLLTGADGNGCGGDVTVGSEDPCKPGGCSGEICTDDPDLAGTCEWQDTYACYQQLGVCERGSAGECGWRVTDELVDCLEAGGPDPDPGECVVGGCSGQLCVEEDLGSTCEWLDEYQCYPDHGICERDAAGECGWRDTPELAACLENPRVPVEEQCVRNNGDECVTDEDCVNGGCGGELCYNPAVSSGASDCDCVEPEVVTCGCVLGQCYWYE